MCEVRLSSTRGCGAKVMPPSPFPGNGTTGGVALSCYSRASSGYRVLRAARPRGRPRSVDRECAGRNAISVKAVEPRQATNFCGGRACMKDRLNSGHAKATFTSLKEVGTTGVRDHGMYTRLVTECLRSAFVFVGSRAEAKRPWLKVEQQGRNAKLSTILPAEVRCPRSSDEAQETGWSEGGHGE
jgi:hypothetical protein